jgi:hypothetical protein
MYGNNAQSGIDATTNKDSFMPVFWVFRDANMDLGGRAPKVGALGDAGRSCREGQDEGI